MTSIFHKITHVQKKLVEWNKLSSYYSALYPVFTNKYSIHRNVLYHKKNLTYQFPLLGYRLLESSISVLLYFLVPKPGLIIHAEMKE